MIFVVKCNAIRLNRNHLFVSDSQTILFVLVESISEVGNKITELLNGAVGFLVVSQLTRRNGILHCVLATFGLRNDVIDGHIIELNFLSTVCAVASVAIVNVPTVHC